MKFFTLAAFAARGSPALRHRVLVLGVDGLDVLPHEALGVLEVVPLAAVLGDAEVLVYDGLGRGAAEAEDDPGPYRLRLALQVDVAGFDLAGPRLAVLHAPALLDGRPALDDVGDVDILTGQVHGREDVVEQLARAAHEGQARCVLVLPWSLAYEHQRRVGVAGAEDGVGAAQGQVAPRAHRHLPGQLPQTLFPVLAAVGGVKKTIQSSSAGCPGHVSRCSILPSYGGPGHQKPRARRPSWGGRRQMLRLSRRESIFHGGACG